MVESSEKLNNQAIHLAEQGEYPEAIACLKRALTMEKENYLLWFNLGVTYRDSGDLQAAKEAMEKAIDCNDKDEETIEALAILCYNMGQLDEALTYCEMGLQLNDSNSHLWNTMGVLFFNENLYPEAAEAFEQAVTINPYYYDALYNLHDAYEELGNTVGMQECSRRMKLIKEKN